MIIYRVNGICLFGVCVVCFFCPNRSITAEFVEEAVVSGAPVQVRLTGAVATDDPIVDVGSYTIQVNVSLERPPPWKQPRSEIYVVREEFWLKPICFGFVVVCSLYQKETAGFFFKVVAKKW